LRRLIGALFSALDLGMRDPGTRGVRLKTGSVLVVPGQTVRVTLGSIVEATLAPERFVPVGEAVPPAGGTREISRFVEERWVAVPKSLTGSIVEIALQVSNGVIPIEGYRVTQHVRASTTGFAHLHGEELRQHLLSLGVQTKDDETYSGYYPTIQGNDVAHHDPTQPGMRAFQGGETLKGRPLVVNGKVVHDGTIRGGTEIRGGRAEYNRVIRQKDYVQFDNGFTRDADRIRAEQKAKREARQAIAVEKRDALLPRKIGEL